MPTFLEALSNGVRGVTCGLLTAQNSVNGFVLSVTGQNTNWYVDGIRAMRRSVCNDDNPTVPLPSTALCFNRSAGWYGVFDYVGLSPAPAIDPIIGSTSPSDVITFATDPQFPLECKRVLVNGQYFGQKPCAPTGKSLTRCEAIYCNGNGQQTNPPNPVIPPFVPVNTTINITYDAPGGSKTEPVTVRIFAPVILAPVLIKAPILITGNNFSLFGDVQLSPEFKLDLAPRFNIGGGNFADSAPGTSSPGVPDGGLNQPNRTLIGAIVAVQKTTGGKATVIGQTGNPQIYAPRIANVAFLIETSAGRGWTEDLPVKNTRQYVPCPVAKGAIDVKGTAETGYSISITPVWDKPASI